MSQYHLFDNQEPESRNQRTLECLGMRFSNDEERRKYFPEKLRDKLKGDVPCQIHSYSSTGLKELRNRPNDDPTLCLKAKDRWYVTDLSKAGDLERLRERTLLRELEEYRESKQPRLKVFRFESVRACFRKAWQEQDYPAVTTVAGKIPENVLQEGPRLLMSYAQTLARPVEDTWWQRKHVFKADFVPTYRPTDSKTLMHELSGCIPAIKHLRSYQADLREQET